MAKSTRITNIIYTVFILINEFFFGITYNSIWPTLVDLSYIYNVPSKSLNFIASFSALGYLIGALSGIAYKWLNRQLILVIMIAMAAIMILFVPYYGTLSNLFIATTFAGIGLGSWDSSNTLWLMEMWPKHQASMMQAQQFTFGLGSITSAGVMSKFVQGINKNETEVTVKSRQDSLIIPFSVIGSIQVATSIILLILFIVRRYRKPMDVKLSEQKEDFKEPLPKIRFHKTKLVLMALTLSFYTAAEQGYFFFSDTMFQYWKPVMTSSKSATVLATLAAAYTTGRLITAFISIRLKPDIIIVYHYIIIIISLTWLNLTHNSELSNYLATAFLGYGYSAMWPAMISFAENHLRLTDRSSSFIFFCAGLGAVLTPLLIGSKLNSEPLILMKFCAIYFAISIIFFIILNLMIRCCPKKT